MVDDALFAPEQAAEDGRLIAFLDSLWEERVALSPEYQTRLGRRTNYSQWDDRSPEASRRRQALYKAQLESLQSAFNRDDLSAGGKLNFDLFIDDTNRRLILETYRDRSFQTSQLRGIHTGIPVFLANYHRIGTRADADAFLARIAGVPQVLAQAADQLEQQAASGFTLPEFSYPLIAQSARNAATSDSLRNDFAKKLNGLSLSDEEKDALLSKLDTLLSGPYAAAYTEFARRVTALAERATGSGNQGIGRFDRDGAYYASLLKNYTTTDLSADEIHALGLAEVERIHKEMRAIMQTVGFDGTLRDFFTYMRTAQQFYLPNTDEGRAEYLALARSYIDAFTPRLDELFTLRPAARVEVRRVEPFRERSAGKAFYSQPDAEGTRPGYFYANLARMEDMPTYQLEALVYHEAIPGHHMQRALQIEQRGLPKFRRFGGATAYTEGWGLYSELLPKEIGFYSDPYSDFGRLAMELWRAARLVVDTGLHAKGWDMDEAITYLKTNTPNPDGDSVKAIERYIVRPGQATAYKIGMMKIIELRTRAEIELGESFDIRTFHDTILRAGPLPLDILEQQIDQWIAEQKT
ncbi:MAG: DUF885 domain-containing protein [Pseudomonadota bacterium]